MARKYVKKTCHKKKTEAKKAQKKMHSNGMTAQVKKDPKTGRYCVYSAGKKK